MFDWNDKELTGIIWGEAYESDDHIVPYPKESEEKPLVSIGDHSKKQRSREASIVKLAEQKTSETKNDFSGSKLESASQFKKTERLPAQGFEMDSWPETPKLDQARDDGSQLDDEAGLFGDDYEDKGHGGLFDYSWTNIGTFDDLDRIFRNDDPIFGCESYGNADELWSSSADVFSSPTKSFRLTCHSPSSDLGASRDTSDQYEIKAEFVQDENQSLRPGHEMTNNQSCHVLENADPGNDKASGKDFCTLVDPIVECAGGKRKPFSETVNEQRKMLNCPEKEEENEGDLSTWSLSGHQFQQFGNQFPTSPIQTFPSSVLSPQRQLGGPKSWLYSKPCHPYLPTRYGNPANHSHAVPMLSSVHSERDEQDYGFLPGSSKHTDHLKKIRTPSRPMTMTPQEKIEKLRRRQQMQAMLAIQEQQQQLGQNVPCTVHSNTDSYIQENQSQDNIHVEEYLQGPNTTVEQDDSNTVPVVIDDYSLEEKVFDQLQDVIGKLDIGIRFCIRDSLFRLAQSAMQRHSATDTSLTNNSRDENEVIAKEETHDHNRLTRMPDAETETNPVDRIVAHFLFHRPLESSTGRVNGGSQSLSHPPCTLPAPQGMDQFQTNAYMNTPEDTSNNETEYEGTMEAEALQ